MFRPACVWAIAAGVFVCSSVALGAGGNADELINQAVQSRRNGDDQGAYSLLQEAYDLSHSPRAAGQRGLCEQALGRWADAEVHVTEALKAAGDPWVKKSRRSLEQSLAAIKSHIARIEISGEPTGAEVLVNGAVVGRLPMPSPVRVGVGDVEIELRAPGYARASKSMHLDGGQYQKVVLRAEPQHAPATAVPVAVGPAPTATATPTPLAAAKPPASPPTAASNPTTISIQFAPPAPSTAPAPMTSAPPRDERAPSGSGRGALKWVAWGLGAASLGVGIFGFERQSNASTDFDSGCGVNPNGVVQMVFGSNKTTAQCLSLQGRVDSGYRIELVGFIGAAVLGATGLVLWLTEPSREEVKSARLACAPSLLPHGAPWLGCSARF